MSVPLLFAELLDRLRREGFSIGTDQYLRMHALFEHHTAASPGELKTLLCPIFAMSAAEQERFHVAYDEFFAAAQTVPKRTISRKLTLISQKLPVLDVPRRTNKKRWRWFLAGAIAIAVVIVAALVSRQASAPDRTAAPEVETASAAARAEPNAPPPAPRRPWLLGASMFALALFGAEVVRTLMRWLRQREHRAKGRPFDWPVRDPHPTAPRLFADRHFFGTARLMKGREVGEVRRLDLPRSILATIRALGDPVFEYKLDRRVTEYLFLVERRSERDHLAAYVHAMIEALARDGVLVEVFEHDGDPRHCWKPGSTARVATADLYSRFPQHRLVIVGDCVALTNPVTGEALDSIPRVFPWNYRAILTPGAETRAVPRFGAYFDVYALADNGLARLAERWQQTDAPPTRRRTKERRRIVTELPSSPDEMERELDPLIFRWLLHCSVHPTLHWDLTRELAPPLPAGTHETALLDLVRLAWFRQGRIPEQERLALVSRLAENEPDESAARAAASRVLAAAPPPPAGSVAARVFEIQQLAHKIWGARDRTAELRPLLRKLRHYPPAQVARDGALMMLLQEAPGTTVAHQLPQPLRQFLFRGGIPAFGMKNFVALAALLPVMLFAASTMKPKAPTPPPPVIATAPPPPPVVVDTQPPPVVVDTQPPPVVVDTQPPVVEPPKPEPPKPAELPKLLAPAAGTVVTIEQQTDVVTFRWQPAGRYTLRVRDAKGAPVHVAKVRGTSAVWRVKSSSRANSWSLETPDGHATDPIPFDVDYKVEVRVTESFTTTYRTVEVTLPVTCGTTEGRRAVDLKLSPRESFVSAELQVLNADAFTAANVSPYDGASFSYRLVARKPCRENSLEARIRVTATLRFALPK